MNTPATAPAAIPGKPAGRPANIHRIPGIEVLYLDTNRMSFFNHSFVPKSLLIPDREELHHTQEKAQEQTAQTARRTKNQQG